MEAEDDGLMTTQEMAYTDMLEALTMLQQGTQALKHAHASVLAHNAAVVATGDGIARVQQSLKLVAMGHVPDLPGATAAAQGNRVGGGQGDTEPMAQ